MSEAWYAAHSNTVTSRYHTSHNSAVGLALHYPWHDHRPTSWHDYAHDVWIIERVVFRFTKQQRQSVTVPKLTCRRAVTNNIVNVRFTAAFYSLVNRASPILDDDSTPELSTLSWNSSRILSATSAVQLHSNAIAAVELRIARAQRDAAASRRRATLVHDAALPAPPCDQWMESD